MWGILVDVRFKRLLDGVLPLVWMGVIFYFSTLPASKASNVQWQEFVIKKTAHMTEYGLLFLLWYRVGRGWGWDKIKAAVAAILIVAVYGASDEFHQSFTPGREPRVRDWGFDITGGVIVWILLWKLLPKAPKKLLNWAEKWQLV